MASASTTTNSELPRQSSICSLSTFIADLHTHGHNNNHHHSRRNSGEEDGASSSMDDILKDIYSDHQPQPSGSVDEVWKRIVAGDVEQSAAHGGGAMTLEDFLTKSGAVREEEIGVGAVGFEPFPAGSPAVIYGGGAAATGRGKRRAVEEPLDKATQQKQRRMIKNRESAARSRERKQAYTVELEALVANLEEENARLVREEAARKQERYRQLMKTRIPVVESKEKKMTEKFNFDGKVRVKEEKMMASLVPETVKNNTRVVLRRVSSMEW